MQHFLKLDHCKITFEDCCWADNKFWFVINEFNALCNLEINSHIVNYVASVPNEGIFDRYLIADIKCIKKVYF